MHPSATGVADQPTALLVMSPRLAGEVLGSAERGRLDATVRWAGPDASPDQVRARPALLSGVELLITGWGGPRLDHRLLASATDLRAVFYCAGSVRDVVTDEFQRLGVPIVSAAAANAVPVADFTVAQVTLALKHAHRYERAVRRLGAYPQKWPVPGGYGSTVGILSLGLIGRLVAERLSSFDVEVIASDPYADRELATSLGLELVPLDELFRRSDVLTVHTPLLPDTAGLITESLLESMRPGATLINTARGAVVDEPGLIRALERRPDLFAILDVTSPEPPAPDSPLYSLPNVVLTPHIAGSLNGELRRIGRLIVDEIVRFTEGQPLRHQVRAAEAPLRA